MDVLKAKLRRGEPALMVNPDFPHAGLVEHLGALRIDAVFLDCELGPASLERLDDMVRAAHLRGASAILRPDTAEPWRLTRFLNRGVDGIMVPHVDSADEARRIVETVRGACPSDHASKLVVVMVESAKAVAGLSEILAVDGIDAVFCGSGDLAKSLGYADKRHPDVQAEVARLMTRIAAAGKAPGRLVTFENVQDCIRGGTRLLYMHTDLLIERAVRELQALVQEA